jgi:hypothetical protein
VRGREHGSQRAVDCGDKSVEWAAGLHILALL